MLLSVPARASDEREAAVSLELSKPCHSLFSSNTYGFPGHVFSGQWGGGTYLPGYPVEGIKLNAARLPAMTQSLELQNYQPGEKVFIVAKDLDGDASTTEAWNVYRATKKFRTVRKVWWPANLEDRSGTVPEAERLPYYKARKPEGYFWSFGGWNSNGKQTPYLETTYEAPQAFGHEGQYVDRYVWESCYLTDVVTAEDVTTRIKPWLASHGYSCDGMTYVAPDQVPNCLGTYYTHQARETANQQMMEGVLAIVPLVGTAIIVKRCLDTTDPACWGEAVVAGATDAVTLLVPATRLATASRFARVRTVAPALAGTSQFLGVVATSGHTVLGLKNLADDEKLAALGHFVGAGAVAFEMSITPGRSQTIRKLDGTVPAETASCSKLETPTIPATACRGQCSTCLKHADIEDAVRRKAVNGDALLAEFREYRAEAYDLATQARQDPLGLLTRFRALGVPLLDTPLLKVQGYRGKKILRYQHVIDEVELEQWYVDGVFAGRLRGQNLTEFLDDWMERKMRERIRDRKLRASYSLEQNEVSLFELVVQTRSAQHVPFEAWSHAAQRPLAQFMARFWAEEWSHAVGYHLNEGFTQSWAVNYAKRRKLSDMRTRYTPLNDTLLEFRCWLEGLSDAELRALAPTLWNETIPQVKEWLANEIAEADIAIVFVETGHKLTDEFKGAYPIRWFVQEFYKQKKGRSL